MSDSIIEIKPMGSYFELDSEGYIINPASLDKIPDKYKKILDEIVGIYKKSCGDKLINVYVRGSVAKGEAVDFVSDFDTLGFAKIPDIQDKEKFIEIFTNYRQIANDLKESLEKKYDFVTGIEIQIYPSHKVKNNIIILSQALCIYGEPFVLPKLKPGRDLMSHTPSFENFFKELDEFYLSNTSQDRNKMKCSYAMKRLLRIGFEITMERSNRYTRDLYRCYETFSEFYPEKEPQMKEILFLAINPISDKNKIKEIMESFGKWLLSESKKYL